MSAIRCPPLPLQGHRSPPFIAQEGGRVTWWRACLVTRTTVRNAFGGNGAVLSSSLGIPVVVGGSRAGSRRRGCRFEGGPSLSCGTLLVSSRVTSVRELLGQGSVRPGRVRTVLSHAGVGRAVQLHAGAGRAVQLHAGAGRAVQLRAGAGRAMQLHAGAGEPGEVTAVTSPPSMPEPVIGLHVAEPSAGCAGGPSRVARGLETRGPVGAEAAVPLRG